jgi:hypothetical protein
MSCNAPAAGSSTFLGSEQDVAGRGTALADDLLDLIADGFERDAQRLERLGGDAFALVNEAEQNARYRCSCG